MSKYYVVWVGKKLGVFNDWAIVQPLVKNVQGAKFKSFLNEKEAEQAWSDGWEKFYPNSLKSSSLDSDAHHGVSPQDGQNIPEHSEIVRIYTDGACRPNPGKSGSGLVIYDPKQNLPILYSGGFNAQGTNNTAELLALWYGLEMAKQHQSFHKIKIFTDSKYSIDCLSWANGWSKNNWKTKSGEAVKNQELVKNNFILFESIKNKIEVLHVKGHSGVEGNELADRMAVQAILKKTEKLSLYQYTDINTVLALDSF